MAAACVRHTPFQSCFRASLVVPMKQETCDSVPRARPCAPALPETTGPLQVRKAASGRVHGLARAAAPGAAVGSSSAWLALGHFQGQTSCLGGRVLLGAHSTQWLAF